MQKAPHSGIRLWLSRLWHLPDRISWMQPLPPAHRRGIILALIVVLLAFLWPVSAPRDSTPRPVNDNDGKEVPLQAEIYNNSPATQPVPDKDRWRSYEIAAGQTLAQLFRDNNLQVNDVFAMARVEGDDKPLSSLHSGQQIKIRQDSNGVVTGLTVEGDNGPVLFTRQPDGSFLRAQ
ncbi:Opacity-associated protein A [Mixta theicola]|uniref:Opacity-associated protein A n=2 Tax=Mixta theicola TaxID=1458355 RepID=A0A2K1QBD2_9GAMM|nr:LysM-like peptidoglycan-binding domain-containing protein [Mixta theicola]PNS12335.1 Opacity-associated protein A [Mixta theicola]GLR08093.1 hypothetical protein GCM10007905_08120 [Mixta theicola]